MIYRNWSHIVSVSTRRVHTTTWVFTDMSTGCMYEWTRTLGGVLLLLFIRTLSQYCPCIWRSYDGKTSQAKTYQTRFCRLWSERGTKANGSHNGNHPLVIKPIVVKIATNALPGLTIREHRNLIGAKTVFMGYELERLLFGMILYDEYYGI